MSSRSPLIRAYLSPASTREMYGNAATEAPTRARIARAARDLSIGVNLLVSFDSFEVRIPTGRQNGSSGGIGDAASEGAEI
jgi:hypothetical protein